MDDLHSNDTMPSGGSKAESAWGQAEALATAHEAALVAEGKPIPGASSIDEHDAPEAEAKAAPAKAKATPAAPTNETDATRKQLEALATKLGMKVDGNRVEVAERVKLREEKRLFRENVEKEVTQHRARLQEAEGRSAAGAAKAAAFEKALESGDADAIAKAAGFSDWRALLNEQTKRLASPEYRRIQELEKKQAEIEARETQAREQHVQRERGEQESRAMTAYKSKMADEMRDMGGQFTAMSADPDVVDVLYRARVEHYRATGDELDLEELASTPTRMFGGKAPLDLLREKWEALSVIFGDRPAAKAEASDKGVAPRGGKTARNAPKTVSQRNTAEASPTSDFKDEKEFMRYFTRALNESTYTSGKS